MPGSTASCGANEDLLPCTPWSAACINTLSESRNSFALRKWRWRRKIQEDKRLYVSLSPRGLKHESCFTLKSQLFLWGCFFQLNHTDMCSVRSPVEQPEGGHRGLIPRRPPEGKASRLRRKKVPEARWDLLSQSAQKVSELLIIRWTPAHNCSWSINHGHTTLKRCETVTVNHDA